MDTAHKLFTTTFPRGFAVEILQVYSGPPVIAYKFRHWGYMEGPFKGQPPTGELVEMFGVTTMEVSDTNILIYISHGLVSHYAFIEGDFFDPFTHKWVDLVVFSLTDTSCNYYGHSIRLLSIE